MAGVILENVSRVYPGNVVAVDRVDLEIRDREFLVLLGPSGCGKTTTLRLVAGLEEISSGKITIAGRVVNDVPPKLRDIAMVFQNYALYPHMTVYRNMAFGLELRENVNGWGRLWRWALPADRKRELEARRLSIAQRVHEAARILGIEELLERLPRQLSGGQRQRVALGRAIVRNPAVFLFDEPLSNLDAKLRVDMRRELKQLHQRLEATMVYVTHDQVEALTLGDRIAVMNEGKVQQLGPPMEVYDWPANRFVAGFIGTPAMNFIEGEIAADGGLWFRRGAWSVPLAARRLASAARGGKRAILGVRPDDVMITDGRAPGGIAAVVELTEMLGDAAVATLAVNATGNGPAAGSDEGKTHSDQRFYVTTKTDPRADWRPGSAVTMGVNPERIHLFDPETGDNWVQQPL